MLLAAYANKMMRPVETLESLLAVRRAIRTKLAEYLDHIPRETHCVGLQDALKDVENRIKLKVRGNTNEAKDGSSERKTD